MAKKKTETVVVTWRVKEALRRRLEAAAAHNEVSVNAEITRRVEESFARSEMVGLTENVDRLSGLYRRAQVSAEQLERYRQYAIGCLEVAKRFDDPETKLTTLNMAQAWLRLAESASAKNPTSDDTDLDFALAPRAPAEAEEERQARLRASADDLLKNAKRNEARSANDLGAEPREWDTRARGAPPRPRSNRPHPTEASAATAQSLAGSLLKAVESGELSIHEAWERVGEALRENLQPHPARSLQTRMGQPPDQEPELPMPRQKGGKS